MLVIIFPMRFYTMRYMNDLTLKGDRRFRDRMVAGFITTYAISAYHHQRCEFESSSGEVYSIQHYVIKFVINLRQIGVFFRALRFPSPIKLIATKYC